MKSQHTIIYSDIAILFQCISYGVQIENTVNFTEKTQSGRDDLCELLNKTISLTNTLFLNDNVNENKYFDDIIIINTRQITFNRPWQDLFVI